MNNIEKYPKCHMRTSLGNCDPIGGFCTSVNEAICEALHRVADRPTGEWINGHSTNGIYYKRCDQCFAVIDETFFAYDFDVNFCPHCGAKMVREDGEE